MGKKPPPVILGTLERDAEAEGEVAEWCAIAMVLHDLKRARIGHFGHPIEHMLDMQTDQTALTAAFGCHVVQTEADDLITLSRAATEEEIKAKREELLGLFDTPDPPSDPITERLSDKDLRTAALAAATLDKFVEAHRLDGRFRFVIAEGESVQGPIPPTGNTNTRGFFAPDVRTFLKRWVAAGPTHHFALGVGHHAHCLERIADILALAHITVTPAVNEH